LKGKHVRANIQKFTSTHADTVLARVFSDIFTDDKSRKVFVVGLRNKSDVLHCWKVFVTRVELETGQHVRALRSDGGGEYTGGDMMAYLDSKGIQSEVTTPYTPQHNGVSERMNRTLLDKVWAMLADADLPQLYWFDALEYAALLHNVTPTRALTNQTPEEAWSGNKPDVSRLRVFGCRAFVHVPDERRTKRLVHRSTRRFLESRDVIFDEGGPIPYAEAAEPTLSLLPPLLRLNLLGLLALLPLLAPDVQLVLQPVMTTHNTQ